MRTVIAAAIVGVMTAAVAGQGGRSLAESLTSMSVVAGMPPAPETSLYVASPERGLFVRKWHGPPPPFIAYGELQQVAADDRLDRPAVLASQNGELFILDNSRLLKWSVYASNPADRFQVIDSTGIHAPTSLAISPDGAAYAGDAGSRTIQRLAAGGPPQVVASDVNATSLNFSGRELQAFDREHASILALSRPGPGQQARAAQALPTFVRSSVRGVLGEITAAVNHGGVYYLAGPGGVLIQGAGRPAPLRLSAESTTRLAVTEEYIFMARRDGIHVVPRPVPATFSFEAAPRESSELAISVFEYLASRQLLRSRTIATDRAYTSIDELLALQRILPATLAPAPGGAQVAARSSLRTRLDALLCGLAAANCKRSDLQRAIPPGTLLTVPAVTLSTDIALTSVNLRGRSVKDVLDERVTEAGQRAEIDADYLVGANPATLELAFAQDPLRFTLAASARTDLNPGTFLYLSDEREYIKDDLRACNVELRSDIAPVALPSHLSSRNVGAYLPRARPSEPVTPLPGVESVEFEFGDATVETLPAAQLLTAVRDAGVRNCLDQFVGADTINARPGQSAEALTNTLITSAVKVARVRFRFRRADGSPAPLTAGDFAKQGILGRYDEKQRLLEYDTPVYIAYRSARWPDVRGGRLEQATPVQRAEKASQDIFKMNRGTLLLPSTTWQFESLLPARDAKGPESPLRALGRGKANLVIAVAGSAGVTAQSAAPSQPPPDPPPADPEPAKTVGLNRTHLFDVIDHGPIAADDVRVGIAERELSVGFFHPDFIERGTLVSAWQTLTGSTTFEPMSLPATVGSVGTTVEDFVVANDHGTHVAGLIGSRQWSPAPGLAPTAKLFLVNVADPNNAALTLRSLMARQVFTFNFSNKLVDKDSNIPCEGACLEPLVNRLESTVSKSRALYILAAGNDGKPLDNTNTTFPPLRMVATYKNNMIGVAATTPDGKQILGASIDAHQHAIEPSNIGPRFIQLAAPGASLYGPLKNGSYGDASGTSQAAPQVAAAAALMRGTREMGSLSPAQLKARLIYASTWYPSFKDKVWGGLLDVRRALSHSQSDVFRNNTEPGRLFRLVTNNEQSLTIVPQTAVVYLPTLDPNVSRPEPPGSIQFSQVLRLEFIPERNRYRVIYLNDDLVLTILHDARLTGTLQCSSIDEWNDTLGQFVASDVYEGRKIPVNQIKDYVARVPGGVSFP